MNNRNFGSWGEEQACKYLNSLGYHIVQLNFRNKLGEIDIIARIDTTICFIEVKTRYSLEKGQPFESVTLLKQRKLRQVALCFLKLNFKTIEIRSRFDVISIIRLRNDDIDIKHIINAF